MKQRLFALLLVAAVLLVPASAVGVMFNTSISGGTLQPGWDQDYWIQSFNLSQTIVASEAVNPTVQSTGSGVNFTVLLRQGWNGAILGFGWAVVDRSTFGQVHIPFTANVTLAANSTYEAYSLWFGKDSYLGVTFFSWVENSDPSRFPGGTVRVSPYGGGAPWGPEGRSMSAWILGTLPDVTPPLIDACDPANGSTVAEGNVQFRVNASDDSGLAWLNHTDDFTGTTIYNATPINATPWYVTVTSMTEGNYTWNAWANDTAGNTATTGICDLFVIIPSSTTTTTTTISGNATAVTVVQIQGLGWGILFFIILVGFIVLGGLGAGGRR